MFTPHNYVFPCCRGSLRISLQEAKDLSESKEFQLAELQAELEQLKTVVQERDLVIC